MDEYTMTWSDAARAEAAAHALEDGTWAAARTDLARGDATSALRRARRAHDWLGRVRASTLARRADTAVRLDRQPA
jgi:hypothetical protein